MLAVLNVVALGAYIAGWTIPGAGGKTAIGVAGIVPSSLPNVHVPVIKLKWISDLAVDAVAIAFLGILEALAIAKAIANETRQPLDYNRQILAEGLANLMGGFFRCLPGSGSLSRSAINFQSGAATRLSGVFTSLFVAVALVSLAPLAQYVPKAALAALLLLTAARLIDFKRLSYTLRASRMDAGVVIVTALSALAFGLDVAILIGVGLSIVLFVPRAAKLNVSELVIDNAGVVRARRLADRDNKGFLIYDLEGELFFGVGPELERTFAHISLQAKLKGVDKVLLRLKRVRNPDVVSLESVGLVYGDIKPAYLAPADAASAFATGAIDAWAIWDPFLAITEITRRARRLSIEPSVARQNAFLLANRDFTYKFPHIVSALNDDVATAAVYTRGHHDDAVQLFSSATGVSIEAETLAVSRNDFTVVPVSVAIVRKQQDVADRFARIKLIPSPIKVADIVWTWTPAK